MKKIIALILALTCAFALFACGEDVCTNHVDTNPKDTKCDVCGGYVSCTDHKDINPLDAKCDFCGKKVACEECFDEDPIDAKCDVCGKYVECYECIDEDPIDAKCDVCGKYVPCEDHVDTNKDALCDVCGRKDDCAKCVDKSPKDARCDVCGKVVPCTICVDDDRSGRCDVCNKVVAVNEFEDFENAIEATEPESISGTVILDTVAGEMKGEYNATIANDGSVTVQYSFDSFNSITSGGAGDVSAKKVGTVTRNADGTYTFTGDVVEPAKSVAGAVTSIKLDSELMDEKISVNTFSATVESANTEEVFGVALNSDATFVLTINEGKVVSFALSYEIEGAAVEIVCEYK